MPNPGTTQFDAYTDEDFLRPLEANPSSFLEYANIFGAKDSTLRTFLRNRKPDLLAFVLREVSGNRSKLRDTLNSAPNAVSQAQEVAEAKAHSAEVHRQARDLEEDVRTEVGRNVQNLKNRNKELEGQVNSLKMDLLSQENLVKRIAAASTSPLPKPEFNTKPSGANSGKKPERAVLLPIFDCQYGTKVQPDDTIGGIGGFDSDVFGERAERYVRIVSEKIHAEAQISNIGPVVFALGGDMVEGDEIFQDQSWSLEMPPTDAVIHMRDWLSYIIEAIMRVGHEVGASHYSVVCTPGNHGKVGGRRRAGRPPRYNWDVMVYTLLQERLSNHPIHNFVIEPAGNCAFEVLGSPFAMLHGDEVASWGSIPFYGFTRYDAKLTRTLNFIPDYVLVGHHHQQANIPIGFGEWLMSGNWVGATSLSRVVGSNQPKQSMFMVDKRHGVLDRIPVLLDDSRKPQPTIHKTS